MDAARPAPRYLRVMHANVILHKIYQRVHARITFNPGVLIETATFPPVCGATFSTSAGFLG